MSFTSQTARKLRIPLPVIEQVTASLLHLLTRAADPADVQSLLCDWPEAQQLLSEARTASDQQSLLARLGTFLFAMPLATRNARTAMLAAGLRETELVPFVAAFVAHARELVDATTLSRMVVRVPGLSRLCRWPLVGEHA